MKQYLLRALAMAEKRQGYCAPNPAVGAVLVKDGHVVATGLHWAAGYPHAEVDALQGQDDWSGAELYVTLEPCCHEGKTPPCTTRIIAAGIQRVVFAFQDPNPVVAGKGQAVLLAAGIECVHHRLPEVDLFYRSYAYWIQHQRPWVRIKLALSADYKIAAKAGDPVQITGQDCQALTHQYRRRSDAILTSVETIIHDNPKLNVRLPDAVIAKPVFVIDRQLRIDPQATILNTASRVTVYHANKIAPLDALDCVAVPETEQGLDLFCILDDLGQRGIQTLWVEVGPRLFHAFCQHHAVNEIILYRSPQVLGESAVGICPIDEQFIRSLDGQWQPIGEDEQVQLTMGYDAAKLPR